MDGDTLGSVAMQLPLRQAKPINMCKAFQDA